MKTIEQVLRECPRHDCAYVLYNGRWHRIEEHEVRAIQAAIAEGDLDNKDVRIKLANGYEPKWDEEKPWRLENISFETNLFTLCGRLHMKTLAVERERNDNEKNERI